MDKIYRKVLDFYKSYLNNVVQILVKEGVHSNIFTFIGFFLCVIFAFLMIAEGIRQAGAVALVMALCDIMGTLVSEASNQKQKRSILLESILDKYSEIIFYAAIIVTTLQVEYTITALFVFMAFIGTSVYSFIVLKAKQFDMHLDWGYIRRPERIMLLAVGMFFGFTGLMISSMIVAVATNAVAVHFIWNIWFDKKD
ncbi:MAG: hypothetical protein NTY22_04225 [Proteobacteria bacterium]|nr:hypothetical protein [Pseudomonadota bacterium]